MTKNTVKRWLGERSQFTNAEIDSTLGRYEKAEDEGVLASKALDVLRRREWNLITLGNGLWYASGKEGLIGPRGDPVCDSNPFKALVLADAWWKEKKE